MSKTRLRLLGIGLAASGVLAAAILIPSYENVSCVAHMTKGNITAADMPVVDAFEVAWSICENHR